MSLLHRHNSERCRLSLSLVDVDREASFFVLPEERRIDPGSLLDVFPGEGSIVTRPKTFQLETSGSVGTGDFVHVRSIDSILRRIRKQGNDCSDHGLASLIHHETLP